MAGTPTADDLVQAKIWRGIQAGHQSAVSPAVNPHGFAWLRRVNEDNVDLNRNFIDFPQPPCKTRLCNRAGCSKQWWRSRSMSHLVEQSDWRAAELVDASDHILRATGTRGSVSFTASRASRADESDRSTFQHKNSWAASRLRRPSSWTAAEARCKV